MTRHAHRAVIRLAVMAVAIGACSGAQPPSATPPASTTPSPNPEAAGSTTRTSEGGQVTVVATWPGPDDGAELDVTLDTHSVDLDALDLADAILRNDRGETLTARPWAAPKGGHHREGALTFDGDSASFLDGATWIELVLTGVGDLPERTLRWEVGP
ncbi:MAG: hypothetical protein ACSLFN_05355 [Candidatus Limnocylindrales bacterium]